MKTSKPFFYSTFLTASLIVTLFAALPAQSAVWENTQQWSSEWENRFSNWVENSWDDEIFIRQDSELKDIATDCADASYTMRMYFSYKNGLPFKINNPQFKFDKTNSTSVDKFITNSTKRFDSIKDPLSRFRAFVDFVNQQTSTRTLANDTYPIEINRSWFRPGIVYVAPNDHTYQIKKIAPTGIPVIYSSTVPRKIRYLQIVHSFPFYMPKDFTRLLDGYRAFKQPHHFEMSNSLLPGFSLTQYQLSNQFGDDVNGYEEALMSRLQTQKETILDKTQRLTINICSFVQLRAAFVASTLGRRYDDSCLDRKQYDALSTPGRDKKIKMLYDHLYKVYQEPAYKNARPGGYKLIADAIFNENGSEEEYNLTLDRWCGLTYMTGKTNFPVTLRSVWKAFQENRLVSDPNANLNQRWGQEDYIPRCPQY